MSEVLQISRRRARPEPAAPAAVTLPHTIELPTRYYSRLALEETVRSFAELCDVETRLGDGLISVTFKTLDPEAGDVISEFLNHALYRHGHHRRGGGPMSVVRKSVAVPTWRLAMSPTTRFRHLPNTDTTIVTNDAGRYHLMPRAEFGTRWSPATSISTRRTSRPSVSSGFLRSQPKIDVLADRLRDRRGYLQWHVAAHHDHHAALRSDSAATATPRAPTWTRTATT